MDKQNGAEKSTKKRIRFMPLFRPKYQNVEKPVENL